LELQFFADHISTCDLQWVFVQLTKSKDIGGI